VIFSSLHNRDPPLAHAQQCASPKNGEFRANSSQCGCFMNKMEDALKRTYSPIIEVKFHSMGALIPVEKYGGSMDPHHFLDVAKLLIKIDIMLVTLIIRVIIPFFISWLIPLIPKLLIHRVRNDIPWFYFAVRN
jgi:hypothetical protein